MTDCDRDDGDHNAPRPVMAKYVTGEPIALLASHRAGTCRGFGPPRRPAKADNSCRSTGLAPACWPLRFEVFGITKFEAFGRISCTRTSFRSPCGRILPCRLGNLPPRQSREGASRLPW